MKNFNLFLPCPLQVFHKLPTQVIHVRGARRICRRPRTSTLGSVSRTILVASFAAAPTNATLRRTTLITGANTRDQSANESLVDASAAESADLGSNALIRSHGRIRPHRSRARKRTSSPTVYSRVRSTHAMETPVKKATTARAAPSSRGLEVVGAPLALDEAKAVETIVCLRNSSWYQNSLHILLYLKGKALR